VNVWEWPFWPDTAPGTLASHARARSIVFM
jgi:hypothetical protein